MGKPIFARLASSHAHVPPQPGFDSVRRRPVAGPRSRQLSHFIVGAGRLRVLHIATMAQARATFYLNPCHISWCSRYV